MKYKSVFLRGIYLKKIMKEGKKTRLSTIRARENAKIGF